MRNLIYFSFFIFIATACHDDEPGAVQMKVNHYVQPHVNMESYSFNYFVQEGGAIGGQEWAHHYDNYIEGFDYKMGYVYDILVQKEKIENPVTDGPNVKTTLIKVISAEKVPEHVPFEIRLSKTFSNGFQRIIYGDLASGFTLFYTNPHPIAGNSRIDCGSLCDELSQGLADEQSLVGVFNHTDNGIRLIELRNE